MKIIHYLHWLLGIILIFLHSFFSNQFIIDNSIILIYFISSIPFIAQYIKKAKFPGAEFEFKEEISETQKLVRLSFEQAEKVESAGEAKILPFETFKLSAVGELLDYDPVLALAALRIEIEKRLRSAADFLDLPMKDKLSISKFIEAVSRKNCSLLSKLRLYGKSSICAIKQFMVL